MNRAFATCKRTTGLDLAVWLCAGVFALSIHAGAAALAISSPGDQMAEAGPAPALMLELAPEPVSEHTDFNQISEDRQDAAEHIPPSPPPPLPEQAEAAPVPEPEEAIEQVTPSKPREALPPNEAPVEHPVTLPDHSAIPLPTHRPSPEVAKPEDSTRRIEKRVKQKPAPATIASTRAAANLKKAKRTAANASRDGAARSPTAVATWKGRLATHLERRKKYPPAARARGDTGIAVVIFSIDTAGRVLSVSLTRTSGFDTLDRAAIAMVKRASPVPAPPPGADRTITAPVRFVQR